MSQDAERVRKGRKEKRTKAGFRGHGCRLILSCGGRGGSNSGCGRHRLGDGSWLRRRLSGRLGRLWRLTKKKKKKSGGEIYESRPNDIVEGCQRKELRWLGGLLGLIVIDETSVIKKGKRKKGKRCQGQDLARS